MPKEGEWLSREKVEELEAYNERGVAPPDEFDDVIFDNTRGGNVGGGYRYKTAGEKKAEKTVADEAVATAERRAKLLEKVDKQAVGANVAEAARVPVQDVDATGATVRTPAATTTAGGGANVRT
jgi:hypothetical protein